MIKDKSEIKVEIENLKTEMANEMRRFTLVLTGMMLTSISVTIALIFNMA